MIDFAMQRTNMVESQLRPSDITDRRILRAMAAVPREIYLPAHLKAVAYMDEDIRLPGAARGQPRVLLAPRTLGKLIQLLRVEQGERVLEIGSGTGYVTQVLAQLAGSVIGLECDRNLAEGAVAALAEQKVANARIIVGPLVQGHAADAPYDAILAGGAISEPSPALLDQLRDGGRLVAIAASGGFSQATVWRRHGMHFDRRVAFDASAPMLPGFAKAPGFAL